MNIPTHYQSPETNENHYCSIRKHRQLSHIPLFCETPILGFLWDNDRTLNWQNWTLRLLIQDNWNWTLNGGSTIFVKLKHSVVAFQTVQEVSLVYSQEHTADD